VPWSAAGRKSKIRRCCGGRPQAEPEPDADACSDDEPNGSAGAGAASPVRMASLSEIVRGIGACIKKARHVWMGKGLDSGVGPQVPPPPLRAHGNRDGVPRATSMSASAGGLKSLGSVMLNLEQALEGRARGVEGGVSSATVVMWMKVLCSTMVQAQTESSKPALTENAGVWLHGDAPGKVVAGVAAAFLPLRICAGAGVDGVADVTLMLTFSLSHIAIADRSRRSERTGRLGTWASGAHSF